MEQTLDLHIDALDAAGRGKVYAQTASGAKVDRPVLDELLGYLWTGESNRLAPRSPGRLLKHLVEVVARLAERGSGS